MWVSLKRFLLAVLAVREMWLSIKRFLLAVVSCCQLTLLDVRMSHAFPC